MSDASAESETVPKPALKAAPSLLQAAGLIAGVTILSKLLGALRDWGIMNAYGASLVSDAYFTAFQLPAFAIVLLGGLGGPFHTATVAVFARVLKDSPRATEQARRLAGAFLTLTAVVFAVLSALVWWRADAVMALILHGGKPALVANAAAQLRIMSPIILAGGVVGIFYGLLNLYHRFFWPSLSPAAMSITLLIALWALPHDATGMTLAWATLAGGLLQIVLQIPVFWRLGFSLKPNFAWRAPDIRAEFKQVGEMLFPAVVGTTIGQLNVYVDMFFTSWLPVGGWTAIILGNRLIQLPIGVLQTALLVPIFPRFSRDAAEGNVESLKRNFKTGVVSLWFVSLPLLVLILLDGEPLIRLVFQHGRFTAHDTALVTQALFFLAFSMLPYFARDSITRIFYAFQDSKTPLRVGAIAIVVNAVLDWALVGPFGVGGIALSTTLVTFLNMILLGILSRKHVKDLGFGEMLAPFAKLSLAALAMAFVVWLVQPLAVEGARLLGSVPPAMASILTMSLGALAGLLVYAACALLLRVDEARYLADRARGLLKRG